ncbi:Splicing factor 45 [Cladobotryum mycophilum]|uniref:Splicing factor 45 n=1 Tax=Cladobotryum mycophilum TaxID=491253 RepID=A0ABR0SJQ4_9HYPO
MAAPPPPSRGLSLYDNLLDPNDPSPSTTISSAPVLYSQPDPASNETAPKKPIDPALRFQPIRRPQVKQAKPKAAFPKVIPKVAPAVTAAPQPPTQKNTLADWTAPGEDEWMYGVIEKRQRGGRKNKKKKHQEQFETDWDELYDPTRPTNVDEFLRSDEKVEEVKEWKSLLYRHRKRQDESDISDDEDEDTRPIPSSRFLLIYLEDPHLIVTVLDQFAPPPSLSFAPPPKSPLAPPKEETADEAYARRLALSGQPPRPPSPSQSPPPPPPPQSDVPPPPPSDSVTISRAPVRYVQPQEQPKNDDKIEDEGYSPPPTLGVGEDDEDAQPRSNRPGQMGFAQRLMSKYGWEKGTALGGSESGILNPLRVQVEKRRKRADADGGGWAEPGGKGKIIGGQRKEEAGKFGTMSDVIVLQNMLENMPDLQVEIADGLGQEIGEECGEKYGRVERLYIDQESRQVFIKFTDQVSALRAVNELDGRVFNGNKIFPKFYDSERFEKGNYSNTH